MLQIQQGAAHRNCQGISRRSALKAGFLGAMGLSLPDILRLRAEASTVGGTSGARAHPDADGQSSDNAGLSA